MKGQGYGRGVVGAWLGCGTAVVDAWLGHVQGVVRAR